MSQCLSRCVWYGRASPQMSNHRATGLPLRTIRSPRVVTEFSYGTYSAFDVIYERRLIAAILHFEILRTKFFEGKKSNSRARPNNEKCWRQFS